MHSVRIIKSHGGRSCEYYLDCLLKLLRKFSQLAAAKEVFVTLFPLGAAVRGRIFKVVGHEGVPDSFRRFPVFRAGNADKGGRVAVWWMESANGKSASLVRSSDGCPFVQFPTTPCLLSALRMDGHRKRITSNDAMAGMGAWGPGAFENDDALDWVGDLESLGGDDLMKVLRDVTMRVGYLEAPESSIALAAAEIVAAWKGMPASEVPREVTAWLQTAQGAVPAELLDASLKAVQRISRDSELSDLWKQSDALEGWRAVQDLERRLI